MLKHAAPSAPAAPAPEDTAVDNSPADSTALFLPDDGLEPAAFDRLPLEWNRRQVARLQATLAAEGSAGILLTDRWNIIYFTGLWHTTTERLLYAFLPAEGDAPVWFYPALDRDLVQSWWYGDGEMYFDWHHAEGGFPHLGAVTTGPAVDLFAWVLEGLKKRGYAGRRLAADVELTPSAQRKAVNILGAEIGSAEGHCLGMRLRKTPEEIALARRAYDYFNRIHAYARDLLLEYGTDLTDYELAVQAMRYGTDLVLSEIERDGGPHTAVGIRVGIGCRVGRGTATPHPNQFHYNQVEKGQALQIAGAVKIGGCGGELYRPFLIEPWTDQMRRVWTVARDCCLIQKEASVAGVSCASVAEKIHRYQLEQGVHEYVYHRPAHGEGMEGHQPPYLALGDQTVLEPGMVFAVEPGLYDAEHGFGVNFSDGFLVEERGPSRQLSRLPWSEEWCLVEL